MYNEDQNSFQRVDKTHPLDLYSGTDNLSRLTLFLISDIEPFGVSSSQIINVSTGRRKDSRWGISFTLLDNQFIDMFNRFCSDIIESSRSITDKNKGTEFIVNRYIKWQTMLSKTKGTLLSESVVKGLIGEIIFLKDQLIPMYGQKVAINSWIGPEKADQDFVCENTWYEVKATGSGSESVNISSIEQLDMPTSGELVVMYLDKTSVTDDSKVTLNQIYKILYDSLENEELKNKLAEKLLNLGFFSRPEYDDQIFKLSKIDKYVVDNRFPSIHRSNLPNAIINLKYQLSLSSIGDYLMPN